MINDLRKDSSTCRTCGAILDAAVGLADTAVVNPGALSLCAYCGTWSVFDGDLRLRAPQNRGERRQIDRAIREHGGRR